MLPSTPPPLLTTIPPASPLAPLLPGPIAPGPICSPYLPPSPVPYPPSPPMSPKDPTFTLALLPLPYNPLASLQPHSLPLISAPRAPPGKLNVWLDAATLSALSAPLANPSLIQKAPGQDLMQALMGLALLRQRGAFEPLDGKQVEALADAAMTKVGVWSWSG